MFEAILIIIGFSASYGFGWAMRESKYERDKKAEEIRTALEPSGDYLSDTEVG